MLIMVRLQLYEHLRSELAWLADLPFGFYTRPLMLILVQQQLHEHLRHDLA